MRLTIMKVVILPQGGLLYSAALVRNPVAGAPKMFSVQLEAENGQQRMYGNVKRTQKVRAYVNMEEAELGNFLGSLGLAKDGEDGGWAVQPKVKDLPAMAFKKHIADGCHDFQLVTYEETTPQYDGQAVAANLNRKKVYIDANGNPIYRSVRAFPIEGYRVVKGTEVLYDSATEMDSLWIAFESGISTEKPTMSALRTALGIQAVNPGSAIEMLSTDRDGICVVPKDKRAIVGSRAMTAEEEAERVALNTRLGRPTVPTQPTNPNGDTPQTALGTTETTVPTGGEIATEQPLLAVEGLENGNGTTAPAEPAAPVTAEPTAAPAPAPKPAAAVK
jgi:hypothetical protein